MSSIQPMLRNVLLAAMVAGVSFAASAQSTKSKKRGNDVCDLVGGCPSPEVDTLGLVQALQEKEDIISAETKVLEAESKKRDARCKVDPNCPSNVQAATLTIPPPPDAEALIADRESDLAKGMSIAGIYKKPDGSLTADLFVNQARVPVAVGSELPGGFTVGRITASSVEVIGRSRNTISLSFPGISKGK